MGCDYNVVRTLRLHCEPYEKNRHGPQAPQTHAQHITYCDGDTFSGAGWFWWKGGYTDPAGRSCRWSAGPLVPLRDLASDTANDLGLSFARRGPWSVAGAVPSLPA